MPLFRAARVARFAVLLLAALLIAQGCATTIPGRARQGDGIVTADVDTADVDTAVVHGSRGGPIDEVATATLLDMQSYWRATFEPAFRVPWRGLSGGFYSVDTGDPVAPPPPCMDAAARLEGNALYCPSADAVVWDRSALLPVLRMRYGDGGVMVVLAHEVGHAVHNRLGIDPVRMRHQPNRYPTILTEAMADCYAGSFVRWVVDGHAEHLRLDQQELDRTLSALVTFRDPAGTSATDASAHGNAFDRVSAFQDGYQQGAGLCARFTVANRTFTQQRSTSLKDLEAIGRHGNLPFDRLIGAITPDLADYFARLVTHRGGHWQAPLIRAEQTTPACSAEQGPIAFCPPTAPSNSTRPASCPNCTRTSAITPPQRCWPVATAWPLCARWAGRPRAKPPSAACSA